jgi:hypothetical protein
LTGESKVTRENLLLCCSAHRKFNIIWPGLEPGN